MIFYKRGKVICLLVKVDYFLEKKKHLEKRLLTQQELTDKNNKWLILGKKMQTFIDRYNSNSKKKDINKPLLDDVRTFIAMESGKTEESKRKEKLKAATTAVAKPAKKKKVILEKDEFQQQKISVGSTVKLIATKQSGTVEEVTGNQITVEFGFLRMKVEREKLMWIK